MNNPLRVNAQRLWSTIEDTARFGATANNGLDRQALTATDGTVRDWFCAQARGLGLDVRVDRLGTIFATRAGRNAARDAVAIGSHLDTQPKGGRFDGVLGVLAGLEALRTLDDAGIVTDAPLTLINWTNEEGARFAPPMMASSVYAGAFPFEAAIAARDSAGTSVGEALASIGYAGEEDVGQRRFSAYLELHIEQGPVLEAQGKTVGVVGGAKGMIWYDVVIAGFEAHAGTTPMTLRRDALASFAELANGIERLVLAEGPEAVGTIGRVSIEPGSRNTVPGSARFTLEFRHFDADALSRLDGALRDLAQAIGTRRHTPIQIQPVFSKDPVLFAPAILSSIENAARALGHDPGFLPSGAGHDACAIAGAVPSGMIFIPCRDGISHNEAEWAEPDHCAAGADVLLNAALDLAR
ncbi:Zn-dependent hydrolase [Terrihabitans sp. B22-R8]|uniref:Zn-dependent hydrolase n=1 Tax=Terrihabitans sp. B22-R8 TaxID=3425128 RepID=UPI00403D1F1E